MHIFHFLFGICSPLTLWILGLRSILILIVYCSFDHWCVHYAGVFVDVCGSFFALLPTNSTEYMWTTEHETEEKKHTPINYFFCIRFFIVNERSCARSTANSFFSMHITSSPNDIEHYFSIIFHSQFPECKPCGFMLCAHLIARNSHL